MLAHGEHRHLEAGTGGSQVTIRLVGGRCRGHQEQAVQIQRLDDLVGDEQVAKVDRVEGAAEHAHARDWAATHAGDRLPTRRIWSSSARARRPGLARGAWRSRYPSRRTY